MHIGLNLIYLVPGETGGMETVARELLPALVAAAPPGTRFTAFVNRDGGPGPWRELMDTVEVPVRVENRLQWVRGEQQLLPRLAASAGVTLLHSLASTAPAWGRFARVVTVHDLIYRIHPEAHAGMRAMGMRVLVPLAVRRSDRVIADSESTKRDLVALLHTPADRIDVVPLGAGASAARANALPEAQLRERLGLGERPVLLALSAKRPHKNIERLLEALAMLAERPLLIVAGYTTAHEAVLREQARALGIEDDVHWPGWLDDAELEGLWAITRAFVYPSLYEGFGLPVLEAMVRAVPVACSQLSSLPEVAGDAALLFDPREPAQIAAAIREILGDPALAARLRDAGRERAALFTWERSAALTIETYERALAAHRAA